MLKNIKVGVRVKWVDKPWTGDVIEMNGSRALVLLDDGFEEWEQLSNLLMESQGDEINSIEIFD